ncbi:peptidylprolyl isomerase [Falsiporphyromonas endometrii]|uniref:Peptidylprolyl isomerase n=1 Tax=Falsiporphyromonas endometrii TaxID=1387297 RepID=A0ABV9K8R7_9PORP
MTYKQRIFSVAMVAMAALASTSVVSAQKNVIDEVIWMVGDEPILKSDVEGQKVYMMSEGHQVSKDADCLIPEQIAVQKLFLNQAKIDSIKVDDAMVNRNVDNWLNNAITNYFGTREKMEEYFGKKYSQIRDDQRRQAKNGEIVRQMQQKIVANVKVSPSDIRSFYASIPQDSLPFVPTSLQVQIIALKPQIPLSAIDDVKAKLRDFADQVNSGKSDFTTLARLYSEDKRTAMQGGEYGYVGRASLDPEFADVVFNLPENSKHVSQVIKTDAGYHIVQLIDHKGDLINFRQILLTPKFDDKVLDASVNRLDSIRKVITDGKISFANAVRLYSEDKNTFKNEGLMMNMKENSELGGSAFFKLEDLPQDISRAVYGLKVGDITQPFIITNDKGQKEIAIVKLKSENEGHKANLVDDFQIIKNMALNDKRQKVIDSWIRDKQKTTYVYMNPEYRNCKFQYPGWNHSEQ